MESWRKITDMDCLRQGSTGQIVYRVKRDIYERHKIFRYFRYSAPTSKEFETSLLTKGPTRGLILVTQAPLTLLCQNLIGTPGYLN